MTNVEVKSEIAEEAVELAKQFCAKHGISPLAKATEDVHMGLFTTELILEGMAAGLRIANKQLAAINSSAPATGTQH